MKVLKFQNSYSRKDGYNVQALSCVKAVAKVKMNLDKFTPVRQSEKKIFASLNEQLTVVLSDLLNNCESPDDSVLLNSNFMRCASENINQIKKRRQNNKDGKMPGGFNG